MSAFISKKLSFLIFLCSWCASLGIIFLYDQAVSGPRLGPVYDFLMGFRAPLLVSSEILLIETDQVIEPDNVFSVLMTLSEAGASDLLIKVPVLGTGAIRAEGGTELSRRVTGEFTLLTRNIRNLFDGIRLGSVSPLDSPDYVDRLVDLAERGKDRLNAAIIREGEAGSVRAAQAAAVFGRSLYAVDLRPGTGENIPWYSRPVPDRDGVLRRISPIMNPDSAPLEHIVYMALKTRWENSTIEYTETGLTLFNWLRLGGETIERRFPLDKDGALLFERPAERDGFRSLSLNDFLLYDRADRAMVNILRDMEEEGVFAATEPELIPLFLFDYLEIFREDLLASPDNEKLADWRRLRNEYFSALHNFLYGPYEMILVNVFEERIAEKMQIENVFYENNIDENNIDEDENIIDKDAVKEIQAQRDELIRSFALMREKHRELVLIRTVLMQSLNYSFCIMGPLNTDTEIVESSALLANALLTGRSITPGQRVHILLFSLLVSFAILVTIHFLNPLALLIAGVVSSLFCAAGFGISFIINGYWIDPLIPASAVLAGTLIMTTVKFGIGYRRALRFRLVFGPLVNKPMLKVLAKAGSPLLAEASCAYTAIIAVKNTALHTSENKKTPLKAFEETINFRNTFSQIFKQAGALILGFEGDTALACFGSPSERLYMEKTKSKERYIKNKNAVRGLHPAAKAVRCVKEILNNPQKEGVQYADWYFGIDSGECAFSRSGDTGFTASGRPQLKAKMYAALASRKKVRAVIGEPARKGADIKIKNIRSPESDPGREEKCYVLPL